MAMDLHIVFGGELVDPQSTEFRDYDAIDVVGLFPGYDLAYAAWKDAAHRTVDNAHMRYFISRLGALDGEGTGEG